MIRIFSKEKEELVSDVGTWVVKWTTYKSKGSMSDSFCIQYPDPKECYQAFTCKDEADKYAKSLNDAMFLIGITSLPRASVYKERPNSL